MDQTPTGRRLTVPEAADVLGITVEAVRGRIKRGKLENVKDDGTVYVLLPIDQTRPDDDRTSDQSRLVEVLEGQVEDLRARLDREQEANRENRRIIAGLTQRIPELQAAPGRATEPPSSPSEPRQGEDSTPTAEGPQTGTQRPWWRRIFGW